MLDEEIIRTINQSLAEEFELELTDMIPEASFQDDLKLDSLDAVDMVIVLEQAFQIKIKKNEDFGKIQTLGDLHSFVIQLKDETSAG